MKITPSTRRGITTTFSATVLLGCLSFHSARATDYTWATPVDTVFSNAANWTPSGSPGATDNVTFVSGTDMAIVTSGTVNNFSDSQATVRTVRTSSGAASFQVSGTLIKSNAGTLAFTKNGTFNVSINAVDLSGGILALGSTSGSKYIDSLTIGSATISGGSMQTVVGATSGSASITGNLGFTGAGTVNIRATASTSQSGVLKVGSLTSAGTNGVIQVNANTSGGASTGLLSLNNASGTSSYGGVLQNGGSIGNVLSVEKNNAGTQALTGTNTYTGATTVNAGTLLVGVAGVGSLGNTAVTVNAGTLGGTGSIAGSGTVGNGAGGSDAFLSAGDGAGSIGTFTLSNSLSLASDATFVFEYNGTASTADQVAANGVTINAFSVFSFSDINPGTLTNGTQFTVLNNTSGGAISGVFSNLANGGTFTSGANQFQANYSGGTGNDLVLTVVPEPSSVVMLLGGCGVVAYLRRVRRIG